MSDVNSDFIPRDANGMPALLEVVARDSATGPSRLRMKLLAEIPTAEALRIMALVGAPKPDVELPSVACVEVASFRWETN